MRHRTRRALGGSKFQSATNRPLSHTMLVDLTKLLPTEMLRACLEFTETETVLSASHVCARWRVTARSCRVFWRSDNAIDFFRARINSTVLPGIDVTIELNIMPQEQSVATFSFQLGPVSATLRLELERHLPRIAVLSIVAHRPTMFAIVPALRSRADILTGLTLRIPTSVQGPGPITLTSAPVWLSNWSPSTVPRLSAVHMENIALSFDTPQPWFTTLTNVSLNFTGFCTATIPADILHRFPAGQSIRIQVFSTARVHVASVIVAAPPKVQPYRSITMTDHIAAQLLPLVPHPSSAARITVASATGAVDMNALVAQLTQPLDIGMNLTPSRYLLHLYVITRRESDSDSRPILMREVMLPASLVLNPRCTILANLTAPIMPRISGLKVPLHSLHFILKLPPSERVGGLMVEVDESHTPADWAAEQLPVGQVRQNLPGMKYLVIEAIATGIPRPAEEMVQKLVHRLIGDNTEGPEGEVTRPVVKVRLRRFEESASPETS